MTTQELAQKIQEGEIAALRRANLACEANLNNAVARVKVGIKWDKIDVGYSGRYVVNKQGEIYGIKAYGVPHLGHSFGTLDNPSPSIFAGRW
jgi:hypothetical protein